MKKLIYFIAIVLSIFAVSQCFATGRIIFSGLGDIIFQRSGTTPPVATNFLLLEDSTVLLLEDGTKLTLE